MRSSQAAVDLIVANEISSKEIYNRKFKRPCWPGGRSGVTVAIGYDLGYTTRDKVAKDFGKHLPAAMIIAMQNVVGLTGDAARMALAGIQNKVEISWDVAMEVFEAVDLLRYENMLLKACPGSENLSPDCFGALTSITYNRGSGGFTSAGGRYREMQMIRAAILAKNYQSIPGQIRAMKRIWAGQGLPGLLRRRDEEAALFERGLRVNVQPERARYSAQTKAVQEDLVKMNYHEVGDVDGKFGGKVRGAVTAFMTDRGKTSINGEITTEVVQEIDAAMAEGWSRPIKPERANATAKDIADKVPIVNQTWWQKLWAYILGVPTAATAVFKSIFGDQGDTITSYMQPVKDLLAAIPTEVYLVAVVGVAVAIFIQAKRVQDRTVQAYQRGEIN